MESGLYFSHVTNTYDSGFDADDTWGHRATEPGKAVICSLALARLRTDARPGKDQNAVGMAQKLLLFWRKPARRCWWEGITLENVEGVDGKLKVWIRRVWTLEMVCVDSDGLRVNPPKAILRQRGDIPPRRSSRGRGVGMGTGGVG